MKHEKRQQHKLYKRRYESAPGYWPSLLWLTLSLSRCLGSTGWPTQSRDRSSRTSPFDYRPTYEGFNINTRTYTQIHTPPPWYKGGGGETGVDGTRPRVFDMLEYSETILPSVEGLWSSLQDKVYFMGGGTAGGMWCHQQWSPSRPPSWILPRIRKQVNTTRNCEFLLDMKK